LITSLDNTLFELFATRVPSLLAGAAAIDEEQIRFQPPDSEWRSHVTTELQAKPGLNVYLADLRENRMLRSNERTREIRGGIAFDRKAPPRVDCHYLISAWSDTDEDLATGDDVAAGGTGLEHQILFEALAALEQHSPLVPAEVFAPKAVPGTVSSLIANDELPCEVLPPEGFVKLGEFWGTMGDPQAWKPALYLVVTIPVVMAEDISGPIVTTKRTDYHSNGSDPETFFQIAGVARVGTNPAPRAWVQIQTSSGEPIRATTADSEGRFTFTELREGSYRLAARITGRTPQPATPIDVPEPSGTYDLSL
jgi:hypothetical protein